MSSAPLLPLIQPLRARFAWLQSHWRCANISGSYPCLVCLYRVLQARRLGFFPSIESAFDVYCCFSCRA